VQEAFDLWLGNGKPADIDRQKLGPEEAMAMIHDNGGVVFAAHAVFIAEDYEPVLEQFAAWGLDGIETYYKHYDPETVANHARIAAGLGIATCGGSDYHGLGNPDDRAIGDIPFPDEKVAEFVRFLESRGVDTGLGATARSS
jgi:predicted metal-dependent phosphoesterase TrpH